MLLHIVVNSSQYRGDSGRIKPNPLNIRSCFFPVSYLNRKDVASDVGVIFKNVGVLSIESSLFHLFHYTFLQTKHQRKGY